MADKTFLSDNLPYEKRMYRCVHTGIKVNGEHPETDVLFVPAGDNRFKLYYGWDPRMNIEVSNMGAPIYHGFCTGEKIWSVKNNARTAYCMHLLCPDLPNPVDWFKQDIIEAPIFRNNLYQAQKDMINFAWTKHYCEWACEMGLGKTLAAMHLAELACEHYDELGPIFWVGPKSALAAVKYEFELWESPIQPSFMTYQGLTKLMKDWDPKQTYPQIVVFDEASKVKNHKAQMSEAAYYLVDHVRQQWKDTGFALCMTGTPAPKSPVDWWSQIEILRPGYIKEGKIDSKSKHQKDSFRARLAIVKQVNYNNGYDKTETVAWLDDENKCKHCGLYEDAICHGIGDHKFEKSKNEIDALRKRLSNIVLVRTKKDCLDLPDMRYEVVRFPMSAETKRYRDMLRARAKSVVHGIALCRELSDGFIYEQVATTEVKTCPVCSGAGEALVFVNMDSNEDCDLVECPICSGSDMGCTMCHGEGFVKNIPTAQQGDMNYRQERKTCNMCKGDGKVPVMRRDTKELTSPKDEGLRVLLEQNEEIGRFVCYAGFQGSIDRVVATCLKNDWDVMRIDGRGFAGFKANKDKWDYGDFLKAFQDKKSPVAKLVAVCHPEAGGMGLTFTRACNLLFFSNSYKSDARSQSEARIHRISMDINRGAKVWDFIHCPEDEAVLKVLKMNRDLEKMSMIELQTMVDQVQEVKETPWLLRQT